MIAYLWIYFEWINNSTVFRVTEAQKETQTSQRNSPQKLFSFTITMLTVIAFKDTHQRLIKH